MKIDIDLKDFNLDSEVKLHIKKLNQKISRLEKQLAQKNKKISDSRHSLAWIRDTAKRFETLGEIILGDVKEFDDEPYELRNW